MVRCIIFLNEQAMKSWTKDMHHTPLSQLKGQNHRKGVENTAPPPIYIYMTNQDRVNE